jgi:hypothetical protein
MKVYIFNPENDMALADGNPGYTAPAIIRQMRDELYWLPNWWAEDDDIVWNGKDALHLNEGDEICPWGWSPALIHQLRQAGVTDKFLPTTEEIERLRWLSHRQTAVEALAACKRDRLIGETLMGESYLCHTWEETEKILSSANEQNQFLLKAPWSSSGRGLMPSGNPNAEGWIKNTLKSQGAVVVERLLQKVADFALEFWCNGQGKVEYRGLSLFYTNENGAYLGNWVAPEGQKLQWLMQYADPQMLVDIRRWWEAYLCQFRYRGPVGVDMMLCQGGICPCIEINWRMTMGYISTLLPAQGKYGRMVVEYIYGHYSAEIEAFS